MRGCVFPALFAIVGLAAMSFAADARAQSVFDSGFGTTLPISDEALSATTSSGAAVASETGEFVSQFVKEFSGDLSTIGNDVRSTLTGDSTGGSFPVFGSLPVGRFTHPNF